MDSVYTIWYSTDGGKQWKPLCSDVTGESAGQFWLAPPTEVLQDMRSRGWTAKIVEYANVQR